ncbi:MAG: serine phosphatase RsbU (regulator of sigma subunit), partial [Candidatus Promineifilaceae bacterium]
MEVRFGMAKTKKYAVNESGDTFEMVERPHGGLSFVLVDGQRSGKSAKTISNLVARKAIQLLGEGIRDGAAARAAHDYLFTYRAGKVTATLNIISVDTEFKTLVISRNNDSPVIVFHPQSGIRLLDDPCHSIGTTRRTKPSITELPIEPGLIVVAFTDGLRHAGKLSGKEPFDYLGVMQEIIESAVLDPQMIADQLLVGAVAQDNGRPRDDISVLVIATVAVESDTPIRRI